MLTLDLLNPFDLISLYFLLSILPYQVTNKKKHPIYYASLKLRF